MGAINDLIFINKPKKYLNVVDFKFKNDCVSGEDLYWSGGELKIIGGYIDLYEELKG